MRKAKDTLIRADWSESKQLTFKMPPKGKHRFSSSRQKIDDIHHFLQNLEWQTGTSEQPNGVTWLELMITFEVMGGDRRWTKEGKGKELEKAIADGEEHTKRWVQEAVANKRNLKEKPQTGLEEKTLKIQLAEFKKLVRYIVKETPDYLTQIVFSHDDKNQRMSGLNIDGHQAAIRAIPCITDQAWKEVFVALVKQKAGYKSQHARIAAKVIDKEIGSRAVA